MSFPLNKRTPEQKALAERRLEAAERRLSTAEDPQTHGAVNLVLHNVENPHPHYPNLHQQNLRTPEQLALAKKRLAAAPIRQYANHNHNTRNAAVCVPGNVGCMPGFKLFPNLGIYRTYKNWRARKAAQKRQAINSKKVMNQPLAPIVEIPRAPIQNRRTPQQRAVAEARVRALANRTRKANQVAGRRQHS